MEETSDPPGKNEPPEPPPFDPDPELIAYLERRGKPSEREVRELAEELRDRR